MAKNDLVSMIYDTLVDMRKENSEEHKEILECQKDHHGRLRVLENKWKMFLWFIPVTASLFGWFGSCIK